MKLVRQRSAGILPAIGYFSSIMQAGSLRYDAFRFLNVRQRIGKTIIRCKKVPLAYVEKFTDVIKKRQKGEMNDRKMYLIGFLNHPRWRR